MDAVVQKILEDLLLSRLWFNLRGTKQKVCHLGYE